MVYRGNKSLPPFFRALEAILLDNFGLSLLLFILPLVPLLFLRLPLHPPPSPSPPLTLSLPLPDSGFFGNKTYFHFLQGLEDSLPDGASIFSNFEVDTHSISTALGRGRAFLCHALNTQDLHNFLSVLVWNREAVKEYYEERALLRNEEHAQTFLCLWIFFLFSSLFPN